jgi:hypothetical protein
MIRRGLPGEEKQFRSQFIKKPALTLSGSSTLTPNRLPNK